MPQIARLDDANTIVRVDSVNTEEWKTDRESKTVQLPDAHDMGDKLEQYYYDFELHSFMPIIGTEDSFDKIIDELVAVVLSLCEKTKLRLKPSTTALLKDWRRLAR